MGKILVISNDVDIQNILTDLNIETDWTVRFFSKEQDVWEIFTAMSDEAYELVIIDDDLMKPKSEKLIRAIKKINQTVSIIFMTSDASIELGRRISQLGIEYYCIKPVAKHDLMNSIYSINQLNKRKI